MLTSEKAAAASGWAEFGQASLRGFGLGPLGVRLAADGAVGRGEVRKHAVLRELIAVGERGPRVAVL